LHIGKSGMGASAALQKGRGVNTMGRARRETSDGRGG